ncbi:ATP-binding protein [Sphingomonas sp. GB1N7]|uniref:ATP-binding protein n=1 Tax=Parasphingomonas caseinilytica TaxID=3096158 RepID=UPI002FCA82BC
MISAADPGLIADAKQFAALSAVYDPVAALPRAVRDDPAQAALVASALALASDTNPDQGRGWLLRSTERRYVLGALRQDDRLAAAVAERRRGPLDAATTDLLDALDGRGLFAPGPLTEAIADPDATMATIERIVTALDRTDAAAPGATSLKVARIRLAELTEAARRASVVARGFFGRDSERATIADWLDRPVLAPPARAALVTGSPGIGKSALLDAMTAVAVERHGAIVVRLDFDRAGLDILDLRGLTMEVARQLVERIGAGAESLLDIRLAAASVGGTSSQYEGSARASVPAELAAAIGAAVTAAKRPVLLVLDTLEVLRARGERHVALLFDWIDRLVADGMAPLSILTAGRGEVFDTCPQRSGPWIALGGLDDAAAAMLLDRLDVPTAARSTVLEIADGCPLVMRLAARVVKEHGTIPLPRRKLDGDVTAAFLYRFLLSRIVDPDLRRLAHPGLIARRLSADFLHEVLAPQLGLKGLTEARAQALFDALAAEHWLVERDPADPLFVRHRGDMRALLLPLLYRSRPAQCARINTAATRWFGRRDDAAAQIDAAYHSLQLMRSRSRAPMIDGGIALQLDPAAIDELPPEARAVVERARGERTASFRSDSDVQPPPGDDEAVEIHQHLVDAGDWEEGRYVVEQIERGGLDSRGVVADAVRTFHWRAGHWDAAYHLLADRDRLGAGDHDLPDLPSHLALARLEMRAEFAPRFTIDPIFEDRLFEIADTVRAPGALSRFGALGFMLAARRGRDTREWGKDGDPVDAALALWTGVRGPALDFAFGRARDRLRARGLSSADLGWDNPQLLATLTPYAIFAANLTTQQPHNRLEAAARDTELRLARAGALLGDAGLSASSSNPVAGLADLGLFAEWAGVAAMTAADPDLRRIARAAERWRRTVAGDWTYGRAPRAWRRGAPVDRTLATRLSGLADARAPRAAALAQLAVWAPDEDGERLWQALRRRFAASLTQATTIADPLQRAVLLRRRLPSACVPAATILIADQPGEI